MKAINELREYASECCPEYEPYDSRMMRIADDIEAEVAANYMKRPLSADNMPVSIGDMLIHPMTSGKAYKVEELRYDGETWWYESGEGCFACDRARQFKPRTVEDVLGDFYMAAVETGGIDALGYQNAIERYATELKMSDGDD